MDARNALEAHIEAVGNDRDVTNLLNEIRRFMEREVYSKGESD